MLYQIEARYSVPASGRCVRHDGLPTFYLDADVQGIVDAAHAESVARSLLSACAAPGAEFHIIVAPVDLASYYQDKVDRVRAL